MVLLDTLKYTVIIVVGSLSQSATHQTRLCRKSCNDEWVYLTPNIKHIDFHDHPAMEPG